MNNFLGSVAAFSGGSTAYTSAGVVGYGWFNYLRVRLVEVITRRRLQWQTEAVAESLSGGGGEPLCLAESFAGRCRFNTFSLIKKSKHTNKNTIIIYIR